MMQGRAIRPVGAGPLPRPGPGSRQGSGPSGAREGPKMSLVQNALMSIFGPASATPCTDESGHRTTFDIGIAS